MFEPDEWHQFLRELGELERACGSNKHDRVMMVLHACIDRGIDKMGSLLSVLSSLGYNRGHVARMLKDRTGNIPGVHFWACDAEGRYRNIWTPGEPN